MTTNAQTQRVFLALADPTRRLLFEQLCAQGSGTAASFATHLPITRQAITKHLVALEQAGLVTVHETGRERRYVPQPASLQTITTWIAAAEAQWDHRLTALRSYLLEELSAPSAQENKTHALEASRQERIQDMTKTLEKQRVIHATPQRTFQALTEKAELERWFVQKAEGTMRPGETMRFEWAPDMVEQGQILEIEPSHRLSYTWEAFSPSPVTITFALSAENGGTRLHFMQTGIGEGEHWGNYSTGMSHGWDIHLDHLTSWLETGSCPPPGPTKSL